MKKSLFIITIITILVVGASIFAFGGFGRMNYQNQPNMQNTAVSQGAYLAGEDVELVGTIKEVDTDLPMLELKVEVDGNEYEVHLGPAWLHTNVEFKVGEEIQIVGKIVTVNDESFIVLAKVSIFGQTIELRDEYGRPTWAGRMAEKPRNTNRYQNNYPNNARLNCPMWNQQPVRRGPKW